MVSLLIVTTKVIQKTSIIFTVDFANNMHNRQDSF